MNIGVLGVYLCIFVGLYFEVFLLISFFEKRPPQKTKTLPTYYPTVSMLVPSYNEEKTIAATIDSLLALQYPEDRLEIVVIDDGSKDRTREIVAPYLANPHVKYFYKENGGKYTALNFGIEHTTAEIIGCLDADSFVSEDGLIEMVKKFESDPTIMAITPAMKVYRPRKLLELMQAVEYTFGIFYKKMFDNISAISVLPGPFSLYRREVFAKVGPFHHAHNTEDMEIAFRMHLHGLKIANAHTAYVHTTVPSSVRALVKQRTRWAQGYLQNSQDYSYMYFNRQYGNFGMLALPFGLFAFCAGLFTASYMLYHLLTYVGGRVYSLATTHIPPHLPHPHLEWFYFDTSMLTFLAIATVGMTFVAVILGQKISQTSLSIKSFFSYFLLFGFIAPIWLARAAWGAIRSKESVWREQ